LSPSLAARSELIDRLRTKGIQSVFHYVPLHTSPFGRSIGRTVGDMTHTVSTGERLVRLPLWLGLEEHLEMVIGEVIAAAREPVRR
jgi:dTDP-4-amino-4,6-dideoxygalactose transaminase